MVVSIEEDAIRLAKNIRDSLLPDTKWVIVNIARDDRETFLLEGYPTIPTTFGYRQDKTPNFLAHNRVTRLMIHDNWYTGVSYIDLVKKESRTSRPLKNDIFTLVARKRGYIKNKNFFVEFYFEPLTKSTGPRMYGQRAIMIDKKDLDRFIAKYQQTLKAPTDRDCWYENKQLHFKLANGAVDQLDFTNALTQEKIFLTFWKLWEADGKGEYTNEQVASSFRKLFSKDGFTQQKVGDTVGNIRRTKMYLKSAIANRIVWEFVKKNNVWIFKILPLLDEP